MGLECGTPQPRKYRKKPRPTREARNCFVFVFVWVGVATRRGEGPPQKFLPPGTCSQAAGHRPREFQLQVWAATVISDPRGSHKHWLLLLWRVLRPGTNGCPCLPGNMYGPSPPRVPGPDSSLCPCLPKSMCGPPLPRLLKLGATAPAFLGAGLAHLHRSQGSYDLVPPAAPTCLGECVAFLCQGSLQPRVNLCRHLRGNAHRPCTCTSPIKMIRARTHWEKR